jgi:glycosyltransferase involved in cell wall biosynthesis
MMRICYLADAGSVLIQMRLEYFAQKDYEIHLISFRQGKIENVTFHYFKPLLPFSYDLSYILSIPKVKRLVKKVSPDLLHAYYATSYGFIGACCDFKPYLVSCLGSDVLVTSNQSIFHKWLTKFTLKKASLITSVSKPISDSIIRLGITPEKIKTFPFGIDSGKFFPAPETRKEFTLISTRSLAPHYNIQVILKSLAYLKKEGFGGNLVIIGEGPEKEKLRKLVKVLGISDFVTFVGAVPHDQVAAYLRKSRIYLSMSLTDGASTSLLEAMACGTFPIVSDIPANREWITDNENGFLVPVSDPQKLAERIKKALDDSHLIQTGGKKNINIIKQRGILQNNLGKMESLYQFAREGKW